MEFSRAIAMAGLLILSSTALNAVALARPGRHGCRWQAAPRVDGTKAGAAKTGKQGKPAANGKSVKPDGPPEAQAASPAASPATAPKEPTPAELEAELNREKFAAALLVIAGADVFRDADGRVVKVVFDSDEATDADVEPLRGLPRLTQVRFTLPQVTDAGLAHVAAAKRLQSLTLSGIPFTDDGLASLAELKELELLFIEGAQITAAGLPRLKAMAKLKYLYCACDRILPSDKEWGELRKALPELIADAAPPSRKHAQAALEALGVKLYFNHGQLILATFAEKIPDGAFDYLRAFPEVSKVDLRGTNLRDDGLKQLTSFRKLRVLKLEGTQITDAGLVHLQALPRLREVSLGGTKVTYEAVTKWRHTNAELIVYHQSVEPEEVVRRVNNLAVLAAKEAENTGGQFPIMRFSSSAQFGFEKVAFVPGRADDLALKALATMRTLAEVEVARSPEVTDRGVLHLVKLPNLQAVNLAGTSVSDATLRAFALHPQIKELYVGDTKVTDEGVATLRKVRPKLRIDRRPLDDLAAVEALRDAGAIFRYDYHGWVWEVIFVAGKPGDRDLAHLKKLPALQELTCLQATTISDEGLKLLHPLGRLHTITLISPDITAAGEAELKKKLPKTKIKVSKFAEEPAKK